MALLRRHRCDEIQGFHFSRALLPADLARPMQFAVRTLAPHRPDFNLVPIDKGASRCGLDTVDGSMILLWKQYDVIGETIDDFLNDLGNCGEYCEFIDANPVPMTAAGVREFLAKTEQALQVAVLTEKLVLLLGEEF